MPLPFLQLPSDHPVGDVLREVAVRSAHAVAVPLRRRRPGRADLHVVARHRGHRGRQVQVRHPLGEVSAHYNHAKHSSGQAKAFEERVVALSNASHCTVGNITLARMHNMPLPS